MSVSRRLLFLLRFAFLSSLFYCGSSLSPATCPRSDVAGVLEAIRSPKCSLWIDRSLPEEVNGNTLDKALAYVQNGAFYSVFFYTSKCSFSHQFRPTFNTLSSMFPMMRHLAVEESSSIPSVFSRYGVHGFPTLLLCNKTVRIRYRGSKDLDSLVFFYKEITGEEPVAFLSIDEPKMNSNAIQSWRETKKFIKDEPYLAFSILFVILRAFTYLFPKFISQLKASRTLFARFNVDMGIFSGLNQLLGRVLHVIYGFSSKTRNFSKGAKSARVWASSLASVSLGESSSSRPALSDS